MFPRRAVLLIWLCFTTRAVFYSAMLPLWEGFDEWAHFAVIERMALRGEPLVSRESPVPRDVQASLELAPLPWQLRNLPPPSLTEDTYWQLPAEERQRREALFREMPRAWEYQDAEGGLPAYEALQPPLYAWLMAPPVMLAAHPSINASLGDRVLLVRLLSVLIASLAIPLVFLIGATIFNDDRVAAGCAAIAAAMPEFAIDVARVGNDCVAVVLFTLLTWTLVEVMFSGLNYSRAVWTGVVLGLGLLAKAYFLAALPPVALLVIYEFRRAKGQRRRAAAGALVMICTTGAIAWWWYVRNFLTTGTWTGLSEAVKLREMGLGPMFGEAGAVDWRGAMDAILFSHIWFGGWSGLTVRSWMYHAFYAVILVAAIGLIRALRQPAIWALLAIYVSFWVAELYNVLLEFLSKGVAASMGWYLYAVVGAEVTLAVAGLRGVLPGKAKRWAAAVGIFLFAVLDLYTVHAVAIPYFTGMIVHKANGALAAVHAGDIARIGMRGTLVRLCGFKGNVMREPVIAGLWVAYLAATIVLGAIGWNLSRGARAKQAAGI
ncbi:MAG TPA: glycosyltransferase family 39 protein [Bryobacteraceae bacterium]|nr:glycosyltransferase family 39 protein [Bryobacteraceae bacterium]